MPQPTSPYRCSLAALGSSSNGCPLPQPQFWCQEALWQGTEGVPLVLVIKGCTMEVSRHAFYAFDLDEQASLLSFNWTEKSAGMTDDDYKQALREYARLVLKHQARRALIDLRRFRYRLGDSDALGSWWANEIVPLYNQAGLEKFAFGLPEGEQAPSDETSSNAEEGSTFLAKQSGTKQAAISWLSAER